MKKCFWYFCKDFEDSNFKFSWFLSPEGYLEPYKPAFTNELFSPKCSIIDVRLGSKHYSAHCESKSLCQIASQKRSIVFWNITQTEVLSRK